MAGVSTSTGPAMRLTPARSRPRRPVVLSVTQPIPFSLMCIGTSASALRSINKWAREITAAGATCRQIRLYPIDVTSIPTKLWPYVQQWSCGIQREVQHDFVLNLGYAGSKRDVANMTVERQLNQLPPLPANKNPFGPNEPLTTSDCTVPPPQSSSAGHPGAAGVPFQLLSGTLVGPTDPAYVHMQAACANFFTPSLNSLPLDPYPGLGRVLSFPENG